MVCIYGGDDPLPRRFVRNGHSHSEFFPPIHVQQWILSRASFRAADSFELFIPLKKEVRGHGGLLPPHSIGERVYSPVSGGYPVWIVRVPGFKLAFSFKMLYHVHADCSLKGVDFLEPIVLRPVRVEPRPISSRHVDFLQHSGGVGRISVCQHVDPSGKGFGGGEVIGGGCSIY